jgi:hypothetical protein
MPGPYSDEMARTGRPRRARVSDVHELALSMPGARLVEGGQGVYQVSGRSFVFFRSARPDAFDAETGERYDDVIVFWVADESAKREVLADEGTPFFTTKHFEGHPSVLLRGSRIGELDRDQLAETVYDAWLARASKTAAKKWLAERGLS